MRLWASPKHTPAPLTTQTFLPCRFLAHPHRHVPSHLHTSVQTQAHCLPWIWAIGTCTYRVANSEKLMNMKKLWLKKILSFLCSSLPAVALVCHVQENLLHFFFIKVLWLWHWLSLRILFVWVCPKVPVAGSHSYALCVYTVLPEEGNLHSFRFSLKIY